MQNLNTPIGHLFTVLLDYYGPQHWWPCQTGLRWEIIAGAILTQNTAWINVEKAIGNLLSSDVMSPEKVLETSDDKLQELIRPAGFFTQKCAYLKAMAAFMLERELAFEQSADVWAATSYLPHFRLVPWIAVWCTSSNQALQVCQPSPARYTQSKYPDRM